MMPVDSLSRTTYACQVTPYPSGNRPPCDEHAVAIVTLICPRGRFIGPINVCPDHLDAIRTFPNVTVEGIVQPEKTERPHE